jgi:hypothetical protein
MKKQSVVQFRAHGLFKIIIIITKIIEKKGGSQRKEDDEIGGGEQLTETNGPLSLDEAKTLSQSPPAPAAGLFKEKKRKQWRLVGARWMSNAQMPQQATIWRQQFISSFRLRGERKFRSTFRP